MENSDERIDLASDLRRLEERLTRIRQALPTSARALRDEVRRAVEQCDRLARAADQGIRGITPAPVDHLARILGVEDHHQLLLHDGVILVPVRPTHVVHDGEPVVIDGDAHEATKAGLVDARAGAALQRTNSHPQRPPTQAQKDGTLMKLKNSPGAVAAIGRAMGHIAKARLELKQAETELRQVRGLGLGAEFLANVGLFTVLDQFCGMLRNRSTSPTGLRLVSETPEEDGPGALMERLAAVNVKTTAVASSPPPPPWAPTTPISHLKDHSPNETDLPYRCPHCLFFWSKDCPECEKRMVRSGA